MRVAVLSLLFNWPSTGGGNMHTAGLVEFLGRDGFDVRHFYAQHEPWGIGRVSNRTEGGPSRASGRWGPRAEESGDLRSGDDGVGTRRTTSSEAIEFRRDWNVARFGQRFAPQ